MARPLRIEYEGALYQITARGNERGRIFVSDADRAQFLERLRQSLLRYDVALHAYVLMGNHYHLIAETRRANLGRWLHWLGTAYTVYFNWRHGRSGHLFQGRYKAIVVDGKGGYLLSLSRYLHLNPVRGRVLGQGTPGERRQRLREWKWSSYAGYSALAEPEEWIEQERVLGEFGARGKKGRLQVPGATSKKDCCERSRILLKRFNGRAPWDANRFCRSSRIEQRELRSVGRCRR